MKLFLILAIGVLFIGNIVLYLRYYSDLRETKDLFDRFLKRRYK